MNKLLCLFSTSVMIFFLAADAIKQGGRCSQEPNAKKRRMMQEKMDDLRDIQESASSNYHVSDSSSKSAVVVVPWRGTSSSFNEQPLFQKETNVISSMQQVMGVLMMIFDGIWRAATEERKIKIDELEDKVLALARTALQIATDYTRENIQVIVDDIMKNAIKSLKDEATINNEIILNVMHDVHEQIEKIEQNNVKKHESTGHKAATPGSCGSSSPSLQKDALEQARKEIDTQIKRFRNEGVSKKTFTVGILNVLFLVFCYGRYPEFMWLVYTVETMILMPIKISKLLQKTPIEIFSLAEYCWVMMMIGNAIVLGKLVMVATGTESVRFNKEIFCAFMGAACGPLLGACVLLKNALVFHSVENMASLLIHYLPAVLMYTIRYYKNEILEQFPNAFQLDYFEDITFRDIVGWGSAIYWLWCSFYVVFLFGFAWEPVRRGEHDTVFHDTFRGIPFLGQLTSKFTGRSPEDTQLAMQNNNPSKLDAVFYILIHAVMSHLCILIGPPACFFSQRAFEIILLAVGIYSVYQGASKYTYYITGATLKTLEKQIKKLEEEEQLEAATPARVQEVLDEYEESAARKRLGNEVHPHRVMKKEVHPHSD